MSKFKLHLKAFTCSPQPNKSKQDILKCGVKIVTSLKLLNGQTIFVLHVVLFLVRQKSLAQNWYLKIFVQQYSE